MKIKGVNLIYFSPTGTSKKIVNAIGQELGVEQIKTFDMTSASFVDSENICIENELTIIGIPVYRGRLPYEAINRLNKFKAKNAPVILVVVYGNRAFEDALIELKNFALNLGFTPLGASAFIGEHSYSTDNKAIAKDRPDEADLLNVKRFVGGILKKIENINSVDGIQDLKVPGDIPYKKLGKFPIISPTTLVENCNLCGICSSVCPTGCIEVNFDVKTQAADCTWCCACVKACPQNARIFDHPVITNISNLLVSNCSARKEPEFFM
ncbi:4Fe-4S binding protein [Ancylomarina sp. YFZ004]